MNNDHSCRHAYSSRSHGDYNCTTRKSPRHFAPKTRKFMAVPHERTSQCYQILISMTSRFPSQTFYHRDGSSGQIQASHHPCAHASCIGEMSSQLHTIRTCHRTTADHPHAGPDFPTRLLPSWGTFSHSYHCGWKFWISCHSKRHLRLCFA